MDWSNERYVRVYTRETVTLRLLDWRARAIFWELLRVVDRSGVLDTGDHPPDVAVAAVIPIPFDVVAEFLPKLAQHGCIKIAQTAAVIPNFIEAQEAKKSDAQRQRESRARRRDEQIGVTFRDDVVTDRDDESRNVSQPSQSVTPCHDQSRLVTPSLAKPSLAVPSLANSSCPSGATVAGESHEVEPTSQAKTNGSKVATRLQILAAQTRSIWDAYIVERQKLITVNRKAPGFDAKKDGARIKILIDHVRSRDESTQAEAVDTIIAYLPARAANVKTETDRKYFLGGSCFTPVCYDFEVNLADVAAIPDNPRAGTDSVTGGPSKMGGSF